MLLQMAVFSSFLWLSNMPSPGTSLVAQRLKCLPAMRETWVQSLGWEDPLEKGMATHSSILAWRIPWREEPGGLQSMGSQRVRHDWAISFHFSMPSDIYIYIGFHTSFRIIFFYFLLKTPLEFWPGLHWISRSLWIELTSHNINSSISRRWGVSPWICVFFSFFH